MNAHLQPSVGRTPALQHSPYRPQSGLVGGQLRRLRVKHGPCLGPPSLAHRPQTGYASPIVPRRCVGVGAYAANGDGSHSSSLNGSHGHNDGVHSSNGVYSSNGVPSNAVALEAPSSFMQHMPLLQAVYESLQRYVERFKGLQGKFLPMVSLFFFLSFINTILDSLKDTLVITAVGGGTHVIPYLTVYAVLPSSLLFLVAYTWASQHYSRQTLFNAIVATFMAFFAAFAFVLFPNAASLHPHSLADTLEIALPNGLAGAVGMLRNWTYTLFFCMSELWGDVCMGLLFWGLANDTTLLADAPTLYPLFGLGANVAQALAGVVLKVTTGAGGPGNFVRELQMAMMVVLALSTVVVIAHHKISIITAADAAAAEAERQLIAAEDAAAAAAAVATNGVASEQFQLNGDANAAAALDGAAASVSASAASEQQLVDRRRSSNGVSTSSGSGSVQAHAAEDSKSGSKRKRKASIRDTMRTLANSLEIRCLAVMSVAQGLCTSLMEFAWKCHMHILYPSPSEFTACLGDVATCTGVVTGLLMFTSPLLFDRLGWRGVANATPVFLMWGGSAFFAACIAYQHFFGAVAEKLTAAGVNAVTAPGGWLLQALVVGGGLLYVFSKGAKFSMFKPAEEMVYITMDEEGRTKGKAAIDVVGAQTGKSGGSLLQQVLLVMSAGSIVGILPVLFLVFFLMLRGWRGAVDHLGARRDYSHHKAPAAAVAPAAVVPAAAAAAPDVHKGDAGGTGIESLTPAAAGA